MPSEIGFRAQLLIPEQRKLFDYWRRCRGSRRMPARRDIVPADIRYLLPGLGLVDVERGFDNSIVRLAGSALRDIYGVELTGKCLDQIQWGEKAGYWRGVFRRVIDGRVPLQGMVRGPVADREHVSMFWLRLPLSDDGERVNKVLCYDSALDQPAMQWQSEPSPGLRLCYA